MAPVELKGGIPWRHPRVALSTIILLLMMLVAFSVHHKVEEQVKSGVRDALQTVLNTNHQLVTMWSSFRLRRDSALARSPMLVERVRSLQAASTLRPEEYSTQLELLRLEMSLHLEMSEDLDFFLLSADGVIQASSQNQPIGEEFFLVSQQPSSLQSLLSKKGHFIPATTIPYKLPDPSGDRRSGLVAPMLVVPVVEESGNIVASLIFVVNTSAALTRMVQLGRIGESGETYAVSREGVLVTESRFPDDLYRAGLVKQGALGQMSVRVTDPGVDLTEEGGKESAMPNDLRPLTMMASKVTLGQSGYSLTPYRDYRGVLVLGAWLWDDKLGLGFATEIDIREAMAPYRRAELLLIGAFVILVVLTVLAQMMISAIERRSRRDLIAAHNRLEQEVEDRTAALTDAKQKLEQANRELQGMATTDVLTGLANRRHFDQVITTQWRRCSREGQSLGLLLFDIDYFKDYNDRNGHLAGDECLAQLGGMLNSLKIARRPGDLIARYGGEEFVVILSNCTEEYAEDIAQQLCSATRLMAIPHHRPTPMSSVTISVGYAVEHKLRNSSVEELLERADKALYAAKSAGRNRTCGESAPKAS